MQYHDMLASLYFAGDPHGEFGPLNQAAQSGSPAAMILLGDYDLCEPLEKAAAKALRATDLWWIHGNHDVDRESYYSNLFDSALGERSLHCRVIDIGGVRVAGLGGHFQGRIWHPHDGNGQPRFRSRKEYLNTVAPRNRWRRGLPRKVRGAIWWEDVELLWDKRADVLVTHEAPSCHPFGFSVIDDLAVAMGAGVLVHGHHHVGYTFRYPAKPLTVHGVGIAGVSDGLGQPIRDGLLDAARGGDLRRRMEEMHALQR